MPISFQLSNFIRWSHINKKPSVVAGGYCLSYGLLLYQIADFGYELPYWLKKRLHFF